MKMIHLKIEIKMPIKGGQNEYNIYVFGWLIYTCLYYIPNWFLWGKHKQKTPFPPCSKLILKTLFLVVKFVVALTPVQQESQASQQSSVPEYSVIETVSVLILMKGTTVFSIGQFISVNISQEIAGVWVNSGSFSAFQRKSRGNKTINSAYLLTPQQTFTVAVLIGP